MTSLKPDTLPANVERYRCADRTEWLARRKHDVTASQIGALVGCHPYVSAAELWLEKHGHAPDPEESPAMRRGRLLEPVALAALMEERPTWEVAANGLTYFADRKCSIGCTPDAFALDPERQGRGIVQVKSVAPSVFKSTWRDMDGEFAAPYWIQLQAITEAELTGCSWAVVVVLVIGFGIDLHVLDVDLKPGAYQHLQRKVKEFMALTAMPDLDYGKDGDLVRRIERHDAENLVVADLSGDNELVDACFERARLKDTISQAEAALVAYDTQIRHKMDAYKKAVAGPWRIGFPLIDGKAYTVKARQYRRLTVTNIGARNGE